MTRGHDFRCCVSVGLAAGQVDRQTIIAAAGDAPIFTSVIDFADLPGLRIVTL